MNEEEVKAKIILPFLQSLGLRASDLQLETGFQVRVGRHVLDLSTHKMTSRTSVGARLDILVKRNRANLLIVEVKEAGHDLDDSDRDQAISYARLVHPIAPFSLVTNGKNWLMYDSISKDRLEPAKIQIKDKYELALPEELRNEALGLFLGRSRSNVQRFCKEQVKTGIKPLLGSATELDKKFIPELHCAGQRLEAELESFLAGNKPGFLITAESGMGKTCEMCYHALRFLDKGCAALFFQGYLIESGIATAVAEEFNWTFSEQQDPISLLRRVRSTLRDCPILIFIDGIDEWDYSQKVPNLLNLLRLASDERVKLILSCKPSAWKAFADHRGTPTGVEDFLHKLDGPEDQSLGFTLRGFETSVFYDVLRKYSNVFGVRPTFEDAVLDQARRDPFLLRVCYIVAKEQHLQELTFSSAQLFEAYYRLLLAKTGEEEKAHAQLCAIGEVLLSQNQDAVEIQALRKTLSLGLNETLLPALFNSNILARSSESVCRISFYFQQLRDFIVTFKVLNWPRLLSRDFANSLSAIGDTGMHADVRAFYYRHATDEQKREMDGPLYDNALRYLKFYIEVLNEHFPALKSRFRPGTTKSIGFIGEIFLQKHCLGAYGFREITAAEPEVIFIPVQELFERSNLMQLHRAGHLLFAGSAQGFVGVDVEVQVMDSEVKWQLENLVKERKLNEERCPELLQEALVGVIFAYPQFFKTAFGNDAANVLGAMPTPLRIQYPLEYKQLREALARMIFEHHYRDEVFENKKARGEVQEIKKGELVSYSYSFSESEEKAILQKVSEALHSGQQIRSRYENLEEAQKELDRVLLPLEESGTVAQQLWIERSTLFDALRQNPENGLALARHYLVSLFSAFLENYRRLVDDCFPSLKEHFKLRAQMPICALVAVDPSLALSVRSGSFMVNDVIISLCDSATPMKENLIIPCDVSELQGKWPIVKEIQNRRYTEFNRKVSSIVHYTFSTDANRGFPLAQQRLPLHELVYNQLKEELPAVLKQLRKKLHIPDQRP